MTLALIAAGLIAGLVAGAFAAGWPRPRPRRPMRRILLLSAVFGLLAGAAAAHAPGQALTLILAGAVLAYVGLVDLRRFTIPPTGIAMLAVVLGLDLLQTGELWPRLFAGLAVGLVFLLLRRLPGRERMGWGDPPLAALTAALVGWRWAALFIAVAALAPLAIQAVTRRWRPVPFGFWLCLTATAFLVVC
jgi:hypothetical protein